MYHLRLLLCLFAPILAISASAPTATNSTLPANTTSSYTALTTLFPYHYDIPNSDLYLNIGLLPPLPFEDLRDLFLATLAIAQDGAARYGPNAPLPERPGGDDEWRYSLNEGVEFVIRAGVWYAVTWGILEDVVRGLKEFLVGRRRACGVRYEFGVEGMRVFGNGIVQPTRRDVARGLDVV